MKRLWKSIIAVLLIAALCVPVFAAAADQTETTTDQTETTTEQTETTTDQTETTEEPWAKFTDVAEGRWSYDAIKFCCENNLFKGKSETTFDPAGTLTVAEAVALAGRLCWLTNGGEGDLPGVPDLSKPYARFYDENGKEIAVLDQEHGPKSISWGGGYIALSAVEDDPALPETCTMEVGFEGLVPAKTCKGVRTTYHFAGGYMSHGLEGTGYTFEDEEAIDTFLRIHWLLNPDVTAAECVNEWWYPAAFYLQLYNGYGAITDMCFHIALAHPDENGAWSSTNYDAVGWFPKEPATRTMFANLISGAVADELEAINDISAVPDVDLNITGAKAVLRLYGAGIIVGVDDAGNFNGAGTLTREQAAAILARVLDPELRVKN